MCIPVDTIRWSKASLSKRDKTSGWLTGLIKQFWLESGCVYGYRKVHSDLRDLGESCGINRVYRLMRSAGLKAQVGYRKPRYRKSDSHDLHTFLKTHGRQGSMCRRTNCHDNAVAESFFQQLKRERTKRKIYSIRDEVRSDVFDYIEMFYNSKRKMVPVIYCRQ